MLDDGKIKIHTDNKKEAFDAMRAYHTSEISHKGHAITILQTVLQSTILIYGGLFGLMFKEGINTHTIQFLGICCMFIITVASRRIALTTQEKIKQDNIQYCLHYFEYRKERELLGLEDDLKDNQFISKSELINQLAQNGTSEESIKTKCEKQSSNDKSCTIIRIFNDLTGFRIKRGKSTSGTMYTQDILMNLVRLIFLVNIIGTIGLYLLDV